MLEFGLSFVSSPKIPHYTTLILQTLKLGLFRLNNVTKISSRFAVIIDHSIKIGKNKIFLVLRVPIDILKIKNKAICLSDCEVMGIKIRESWTGNDVSSYLKEIFDKYGIPVQIIRDGGKDLVKGLANLRDDYNLCFVDTSDIGHHFANIIKKRFKETVSYNNLLTFIGGLSKKMALTEIAHLMPPKLRTKGRYLGISRVVDWANNILRIFKAKNLDENVMNKLNEILGPIKKYKSTIEKMVDEFTAINFVLEGLKNLGLTLDTLDASIFCLESIGPRSKIKNEMIDYLVKTYEDSIFMKTCVITSTDIIESIFGKLKYLIQNESMDIGRLALLLPCLCGKKVTLEEITNAMKEIQVSNIRNWQEKEIGKSLLSKRLKAIQSEDLLKPTKDYINGQDIFGICQQSA